MGTFCRKLISLISYTQKTKLISMKVVLILATVYAAAMAANELEILMFNEVKELYNQEPNLTQQQCETKCDALFELTAGRDEQLTDRWCHGICACVPQNDCASHTHAPHNGHP